MHINILNKNQREILGGLSILKKEGFYLAGGTALALQLGHRTSMDFDFYNIKRFDSAGLFEKIEKDSKYKITKTLQEKDTLFLKINDVEISAFYYKYPLLDDLVVTENINLASMKDIAAMKLAAVLGRPARRDYIDVYYLLEIYNLNDIVKFALDKYPNMNPYLALRALRYFDDVIEKRKKIRILDKGFSWEEAKKTLERAVDDVQLSMFEK